MKSGALTDIRLTDYKAPSFQIDHVDITVRLDGPATTVRAQFVVTPNSEAPGMLVLNVDGLGDVNVQVDGQNTGYERGRESLLLTVPQERASAIDVRVALDPDGNTALSGLYRTNGVYCTQCEAEGFRRILPFLDRPDVLCTYTVRMEARRCECPVLLSNGNLVGTEMLDDGWHAAIWHDPHPKPSYLFAMVGGTLDRVSDTFQAADGRTVELGIYVEPGKSSRAQFAMDALKRSMTWDEKRFGRVYDLDVFNIVAVSDFNLGAMENKGLNIFNDKFILASPETATDEDYERILAIIGHEYFHNWSGNRVTCRDWFQLCLKEGLTVFRDQEFTSDVSDRGTKRINDVRTLWMHQFPEDGGPLAHPVRPESYREINNFYTATVYEKGAEIVRMISNWLGPATFRIAMDRYFETYDGQAVRIEEFLSAMRAELPDGEVWPDFLAWYEQAGTPDVCVGFTQDSATGTVHFSFRQKTEPTPDQPDKRALPIPCRLALLDEDGNDVPLDAASIRCEGGRWRTSACLPVDGQFLLEQGEGRLTIKGLPQGKLTPSLFRDFSAPVTHQVTGITKADKLFLATHDANAFNAWAHSQALCSDALQRRYRRLVLGEPLGDDTTLFDSVCCRVICKGFSNMAKASIRAQTLMIPSAQDLARTLGENICPDKVEEARQTFYYDLNSCCGWRLVDALKEDGMADDGQISASSAARRSLIFAMLKLLSFWDDPVADELLEQAHRQAQGMTMRIRSLGLMVRRQSAAAEAALHAFETQFFDDPLAMDKWFTVQANAPGPVALEAVQRLERHPAYSLSNPNRVRALLGTFAMTNLSGFHAADGAGYHMLADRIGQIDESNPQLAARLAAAFRSWKTMEPGRRGHAQDALQTLAKKRALSVDVSDIVSRTLNG
jgi:aminopeptidase N